MSSLPNWKPGKKNMDSSKPCKQINPGRDAERSDTPPHFNFKEVLCL